MQVVSSSAALPLEAVTVEFIFVDDKTLRIDAIVQVEAKTGVEMEALTAASVAALTVYDMCKSVDRGIAIGVQLQEKSGGRSGHCLHRPLVVRR